MNLVFFLILGMLLHGERRDTEQPPKVLFDTVALFVAQQALTSQRRRIDAIEATMAGLAIVTLTIMLYLFDHAGDRVAHWIAVSFVVPVALTLVGWLQYEPTESPEPAVLVAGMSRHPHETIRQAVIATTIQFEANQDRILAKRFVRNLALTSAVLSVLAYLIAVVLGW